MKELEDNRLHSDVALTREHHAIRNRTNLAGLADQLNVIAAKLRGNDAGDLDLSPRFHPVPDATVGRHQTSTDAWSDPHIQIEQRRAIYAEFARQVYASRRRRSTIFGNAELFGEPAWDILLDLYIAHVEGKAVSVSSACIGSAAPPTTGLRWLGVLADNGLVLREHDQEDQRRVLVRLSERGLVAMDEYFASGGLSA